MSLSLSASMPFLSRARGRYHMLLRSTTQLSSDEDSLSNEGLLEKEDHHLHQTRPFWRRYTTLIVAHAFILVIYVVILYVVAASARVQALNGPRLIYCTSCKQAI